MAATPAVVSASVTIPLPIIVTNLNYGTSQISGRPAATATVGGDLLYTDSDE